MCAYVQANGFSDGVWRRPWRRLHSGCEQWGWRVRCASGPRNIPDEQVARFKSIFHYLATSTNGARRRRLMQFLLRGRRTKDTPRRGWSDSVLTSDRCNAVFGSLLLISCLMNERSRLGVEITGHGQQGNDIKLECSRGHRNFSVPS